MLSTSDIVILAIMAVLLLASGVGRFLFESKVIRDFYKAPTPPPPPKKDGGP